MRRRYAARGQVGHGEIIAGHKRIGMIRAELGRARLVRSGQERDRLGGVAQAGQARSKDVLHLGDRERVADRFELRRCGCLSQAITQDRASGLPPFSSRRGSRSLKTEPSRSLAISTWPNRAWASTLGLVFLPGKPSFTSRGLGLEYSDDDRGRQGHEHADRSRRHRGAVAARPAASPAQSAVRARPTPVRRPPTAAGRRPAPVPNHIGPEAAEAIAFWQTASSARSITGRSFRGGVQAALLHGRQQRPGASAWYGGWPVKQRVERRPETINVGTRSERIQIALGLLGTHECGSAQHRSGLGLAAFDCLTGGVTSLVLRGPGSDRPSALASPQFDDQRLAVRAEHDVARLEVAMDYSAAVRISDGVANIDEPPKQLPKLDGASPGSRPGCFSASWNLRIASLRLLP